MRLLALLLFFVSPVYAGNVGVLIATADGAKPRKVCLKPKADKSLLQLLHEALPSMRSRKGAICAVEGKGCPVTQCFCQCSLKGCQYWALFDKKDKAWAYASTGAAQIHPKSGDAFLLYYGFGGMGRVEGGLPGSDVMCP